MNTIQEPRIVPTATEQLCSQRNSFCSNTSPADALWLERRENAANLFYTHDCLTVWAQPENHELIDAFGSEAFRMIDSDTRMRAGEDMRTHEIAAIAV